MKNGKLETESVKNNVENEFIKYNKRTGKVINKEVSENSPNRIGKVIEKGTAMDDNYTYQTIRVQFRDVTFNYIVGKKKHSKAFLKLRKSI